MFRIYIHTVKIQNIAGVGSLNIGNTFNVVTSPDRTEKKEPQELTPLPPSTPSVPQPQVPNVTPTEKHKKKGGAT